MKPLNALLQRFVILSLAIAGPLFATAPGGEDVVINARVFNGYTRTRLADGSFKPERFGVAEGTHFRATKLDGSLDTFRFQTLVRTIAPSLVAQGYIPSSNRDETDLLIVVSWGTTEGAEDGQYDHQTELLMNAAAAVRALPEDDTSGDSALNAAIAMHAMENRMRDHNNLKNARILGYTKQYIQARDLRQFGLSWGDRTFYELEANRYVVVLQAFDFQLARKQKQLKLLWETRFSVYERGNRFTEQLLPMTRAAQAYFGQSTSGLVRSTLPEGKVKLGAPTVLEVVPNPAPAR